MSKLIEAIEAKLAADGVSATAAARSVGLSLPSFRAVLKGKSAPNARSAKKYAKLLGKSVEEIAALDDGAKPAKAAKKKGKAGRKAKAAKKGKAGRKPGPKAKKGRKPGRKSANGSISGVVTLLKQAEEILGDDLAVAVHGLGKAQRSTLATIVKSLA